MPERKSSETRVCPACGKTWPVHASRCPECGAGRVELVVYSRETILALIGATLVMMFFLAAFATRNYHHKVAVLGQQWFARGQRSLAAHDPQAALADFHNALVYSPDDPRIQFQLAEALSASGRDTEAHSYLLALLAHSPSDADVNLALARISASQGNENDVLRYYHGAIYGVWRNNPQQNRIQARIELCEYLVSHKDFPSADSELLALASDIPSQKKQGAPLHEKTGELFLETGDAARALAEFRDALRVSPAPFGAERGAGLASFELGDFRQAERYLDRAHRLNSNHAENDAKVESALKVSRLAIAANPFAGGLSEEERQQRTRGDFAQAFSHLETCAQASGQALPPAAPSSAPAASAPKQNGTAATAPRPQSSELATLYTQATAMQPKLSPRILRRHPDLIYAAMNLVYDIEAATAQTCGKPSGLDEALLLLGKFNGTRER